MRMTKEWKVHTDSHTDRHTHTPTHTVLTHTCCVISQLEALSADAAVPHTRVGAAQRFSCTDTYSSKPHSGHGGSGQ